MVIAKSETNGNRLLYRNILAGMAGILAATLLVVITLGLHEDSSARFLKFSLFVFPVPVACGLAVGMVSPRRAIVWAPIWASIFTLLLFALLVGGIYDAGGILARGKPGLLIVGVIMAALAGLIGQYANLKGYVGRVVVGFVVLCGIMGCWTGSKSTDYIQDFERNLMPKTIAQLNREYIGTPSNLGWKCLWLQKTDTYELIAEMNGRELRVFAEPGNGEIIGVEYSLDFTDKNIADDESARDYLKMLGFRGALLRSLARDNKSGKIWTAGLYRTRLTLLSDGRISMRMLSSTTSDTNNGN